MPYTRPWAMARKADTLTTANANGCRACCSLPTETVSWKRRKHLPLTTGFQIVENALNDFRLVAFLKHNHVLSQTNGAEFWVSSYLSPVFRT